MGAACQCRRRPKTPDEHCESDESNEGEDEEARGRWLHLTRRLRRLAFKMREWAFLGHWLRDIRQRGRR